MRDLIVWLDTIVPLICCFIALYLNSKMPAEKKAKLLFYYLLCTGLLNGSANIVSEFLGINNHWIYHVANTVNIILLSAYFASLHAMQKYRRYIFYVTLLFILFGIGYKLIDESYLRFDSLGFGGSSMLFTLYSMTFYYGLLQSQKGENLFRLPEFWIVTGILFYYASCFFIFVLYQHYTNAGITNIGLLWKFQNIMLSIMGIFLIKGLLCRVSPMSRSLLLHPVSLFFFFACSLSFL